MKLLRFESFNTSSKCQTISKLGEAWGYMERCRDQIETTKRQTPVPGDELQLLLKHTQYSLYSNAGLGWGGSGGGDRAHESSIDGAMEFEGLLPQWGSLQTQVHLHVKNRRQTSWREESFSRRGGHHRQLNGAYKVSKSNLIMNSIDPDHQTFKPQHGIFDTCL